MDQAELGLVEAMIIAGRGNMPYKQNNPIKNEISHV